jgi:hypothetical protein
VQPGPQQQKSGVQPRKPKMGGSLLLPWSAGTMLLLHLPHLEMKVFSESSSLPQSQMIRQKVKIVLTQSTLADSVSHRIYLSGARAAGTPRLAAEMKVKGGNYGDCTQAHPICKTGYGIRLNSMYKSTIRVRDDPKQSVVFRSSLMSLQLRKHLPEDHQQMMIKVKDKSIIMNYGTKKMRKMVPIHGEEVLRIPKECVTMHPFQKTVLHME